MIGAFAYKIFLYIFLNFQYNITDNKQTIRRTENEYAAI